jgi:hypothetical protein
MHIKLLNHFLKDIFPKYKGYNGRFIQLEVFPTQNENVMSVMYEDKEMYFTRPYEDEVVCSNVRIIGTDGYCFIEMGEEMWVLMLEYVNGVWEMRKTLVSDRIDGVGGIVGV